MIDFHHLRTLPPSELATELSLRVFESPFTSMRQNLTELPAVLQTYILVMDFDVEVTMQGMSGFLENSTGLFLPQTIEALRRINAPNTAGILVQVQDIMRRHGLSPESLRADFQGRQQYEITSFADLHGAHLQEMAREIDEISHPITCDDTAEEPIRILLAQYVANHSVELVENIEETLKETDAQDTGWNSP